MAMKSGGASSPVNTKDLFARLVENALDFLARSISDLERHPKYSTIHFYTAVELFVKARLMAEHWSLVVSKRQEPDWEDFLAGDFQSVSLDEAASRLEKTARSGLLDQELQAFRRVRAHRNKAVHFFHEAHSAKENEELLRAIAKEQLTAWYLLHRLLTTRWKTVFARWSSQIARLDTELRKHHTFLQVVFDLLIPEIRQLTQKGFSFATCPSCGFVSQRHENTSEQFYDSPCLVCGLTQTCVAITCQACKGEVLFVNEGFATCSSCGKSFEPDDLVEVLQDPGEAHLAAKDGENYLANCSACDGYHTVLPFGDNYVCASCFGEFDRVEACGWCNEPNTGDMEHSYATGCNHCEGRAGWDRDD
ncbi:MAG: hypothetical protein ACREC3_13050 [Methyloceanibacter sp.]